MANTSATSPGTMANGGESFQLAWTNPDNAKVSDGVYATNTNATYGVSQTLRATNFGFSIPTGATINGILVEVQQLASASNTITDYTGGTTFPVLSKAGSPIATGKANVAKWPTSEAYRSYGSSSDLWGETWTPTDINNSGFGVRVCCQNNSALTASVDHIRITVYYTEGAAGPANLKSLDTNLIANIKSINTNLIANVKSLDTNV
jgi:hypothetical protein